MAEVVIPLGREGKLYYGTPLLTVPLAAQEFNGAVDVNIIVEKEDAECRRRVTGAWADAREGVKDLRITWNMIGVISDAGVEASNLVLLRKTFLSGTYNAEATATGIALYAKSSTAAGGGGMIGDFIITRFERAEVHGDPQAYSCEARMTQVHGRAPDWSEAAPA